MLGIDDLRDSDELLNDADWDELDEKANDEFDLPHFANEESET